jgi:dTDP-glucose 4,6-dehydratase
MRSFETVLVTGGAGFIGSNFVRFLLERPDFSGTVVNVDCLTYAGRRENLHDIEGAFGKQGNERQRYFFEKADIRDRTAIEAVFEKYNPDAVVHLAAESHVDRSIVEPGLFVSTNVQGTQVLLDCAAKSWVQRQDVHFHQVSTDEVYGSLGSCGRFTEDGPYAPRSPYAASKAGGDHLVMAYYHSYGLPVTLSNCSNNYGPFQYPEKFIPLMIRNLLEGKDLPIYGDGRNRRDWIYVEDHCSAIWEILKRGLAGRRYNIGGDNEVENLAVIKKLIRIVAQEEGKCPEDYKSLIKHVNDRSGHDRRYAVNCMRLKRELGWRQERDFEDGLKSTVRWYRSHRNWLGQ